VNDADISFCFDPLCPFAWKLAGTQEDRHGGSRRVKK
jgi:hypothetical protein